MILTSSLSLYSCGQRAGWLPADIWRLFSTPALPAIELLFFSEIRIQKIESINPDSINKISIFFFFYLIIIPLTRATIRASSSTTVSSSSRVFSSLSVSRSDPRARSLDNPIASSTCEGSTAPEVHADPADAQICAMSSMISMVSPSMSAKLKFTLFGRRLVRWPFSATSGISASIRPIR